MDTKDSCTEPKQLRVVLDTNIFVAALRSKSKNSTSVKIIQKWTEGAFLLLITNAIIGELLEKINQKTSLSNEDIERLIKTINKKALKLEGNIQTNRLDNIDSDDNKFLNAAYEGNADYLISMDKKHLLPLKHFHETQILHPNLFITQIENIDIEKYLLKEISNMVKFKINK